MIRIETIDERIHGIVLNDIRTCWVVRDKKTMVIESGFPSEADLLLFGLKQLSLTPKHIDCLALTHIHTDHAGGAGRLARENPGLQIFVHESGVHHLRNPQRLNEGVKKAYGERYSVVGEIQAVPEETSIIPISTGDVIDLGKIRLQVYYTPGHAKHHVVYYDGASASVFSGDALGSKYRGLPNFVLSPPSDYDREQAKASIDLIKGLNPARIHFTHCGVYELNGQTDFFDRLKAKHDEWTDCVLKIVKEDPNLNEKEIFERFLLKMPELKDFPTQFFSFNLSVKGILLYLKKSGILL